MAIISVKNFSVSVWTAKYKPSLKQAANYKLKLKLSVGILIPTCAICTLNTILFQHDQQALVTNWGACRQFALGPYHKYKIEIH